MTSPTPEPAAHLRPLLSFVLALLLAAAAAAAPPHLPQTRSLLPGDAVAQPAVGDQNEPIIVAGGGGFLAVWTDDRSTVVPGPDGAPVGTGRDIYALRLDASGDPLDAAPFAVTRAPGDQSRPRAAWNGQAWLVLWTGTVPDSPIPRHNTEGARVSAAGEVLDATPFEVWEYGGGDEHVVGLASDGVDWAVVLTDVYLDGLGTKTRLVARRVMADGTVEPSHYVYSPACCSFFGDFGMAYAAGTYMLVFHGYFDSWDYGIFGLRLSSTLNTLDSYPLEMTTTRWADGMYYTQPDVATDGSLFYVTWQLWQQDVSSQVYGARIQPDGTSLDGDGVAISDVLPVTAELQSHAAWDGANWVVAWPQDGQTRWTRVTADGAVLDPGGAASGLPTDLDLAGNGDGLQLVWSEARGTGPQSDDVSGAAAGTDLVVGPPAVLSTGAPAQLEADVVLGDAGAMLVYLSVSADASRILAQPLDDVGQPTGAGPVELVTGDVDAPRVGWNGLRYLAVWREGAAVRGMRLGQDGTLLDPAGLDLLDGAAPDVSGTGTDFFVAAAGPGGARGVRVADDGSVLDVMPLDLDAAPADHASVTSAGPYAWIAWERTGSADGGDVAIAAVDAAGAVIGPLPLTVDGDGVAARRPVAAAGDTVLFLWEDDRGDDLDLYGRRMTTTINFVDPVAVPLLTAAGDQYAAASVWDGVRFVHACADTRDRVGELDVHTSVYRGWSPAQGDAVAEPAGLPLFADGMSAGAPAVAGRDDNQIYAAPVFHPEAPYASYRIEVSFAGTPTAVGDAAPPTALAQPPYPNPANPRVTFRFALARAGRAVVDIYDVRGNRVRSLQADDLGAGPHELTWDGNDAQDRPAASGSYLYRVRADGRSAAGKVVLLR